MTITMPSPTALAVSTSKALDLMLGIQTKYVFHEREERHWLAVLWAAHTHGMAQWRYTPRLYITAPEPACGKSTQLDVISLFSDSKLRGSSVTGAALFRAIASSPRTVLLDEVDETLSGPADKTLRAVFNDGYDREGTVLRATGEYPIYAAMALCGIGSNVPDATRTRTIPLQMTKGRPCVTDFDSDDHQAVKTRVVALLSDASLSWNARGVTLPVGCTGRQAQLWRPLMAVAQAAGGVWVERAHAAYALCQWESLASVQNRVLRAVWTWFNENPDAQRVSSSVLAAQVTSYDDLPKVSAKSLAVKMAAYGVRPRKVSSMYYYREDLAPAFSRWL